MKLSEAVNKIREVPSSEDGCRIFEGFVGDDMNWRVGAVPQGGYVLGLLFSAIRSAQRGTPHPDPMHLTCHYIASLGDGSFRIEVRAVKRGRGFANIDAQLVQKVLILIFCPIVIFSCAHCCLVVGETLYLRPRNLRDPSTPCKHEQAIVRVYTFFFELWIKSCPPFTARYRTHSSIASCTSHSSLPPSRTATCNASPESL